MKIVITGHTRGLGEVIYNHLISLGHDVIGLSSSNGYHLPDQIEQVIEIAKDCDYFFNNAHCGTVQSTLIGRLYDRCSIITSGSMAADYSGTSYRIEKKIIENTHRRIKKISDRPMLLLKMGYLEYRHQDKYPVPFTEILNGIDFWLKSPRVSIIEFENDPRIYRPIT
jgi:hypothetical protein